MRLILVRHGETNHNAADIVQGQTESRLSERGINQAELAKERLRETPFDAVYVSDLGRARQTAAIITAGSSEKKEIVDSRLREQHFGTFEQRPIIELLRQMAGDKKDFATFIPPGGESRPDFSARVMDFYTELKAARPDQTVLIVTHYGVINILLGSFLNHESPLSNDWQIDNGSITILDIDDRGRADTVVLNDIAHLAEIEDTVVN